jgi:beta-glucosidase
MILRGMQTEPITFEIDGRRVRDLNGNGELDPYEGPRRPLQERVDDLLAQMTLAEKAGLMFDRPAILTELAEASGAAVRTFGASPDAILDLVFGRFQPSGKLPFELPSSMDAVLRQLPYVPCDSEQPLYALGHGLTYEGV